MTHDHEPGARDRVRGQYAVALRDYVSGAGEAALAQAYELGRHAAAVGIGVLELAMVHHDALLELPALGTGGRPSVALAAELFAEALSPFEMTLRAYQANARLLGLSETIERQNGEMARAHAQLRTILDATQAVIYLKDAAGRYLFVNKACQEAFGLGRDQLIGRHDDEILPTAVGHARDLADRAVLDAATPRELEESIPAADGPHTYLSLKFPLLDAARVPYALCCVATDITQRKHADEALRQAKEAVEDANRELEAFSYSVAHDLRAPLRTIDRFSLELLEDDSERLDDRGATRLRSIRKAAQHMAQLIDDLLGLARVSRGELRRARVDLSALARGIVERLQLTDPERDAEFVIEPEMVGWGDARLLGVVLENLFGNAWKFTARRAAARIEFGIGATGQGAHAVHVVRDNGAGFDMAHAARLFGVFQRLHPASEFEGTGIGLATVQRIIRRHGGRVWAEGVVGQGAAFYFTLGEPKP